MTDAQRERIKQAARELESALNDVDGEVNVDVSRYAAGISSEGKYRYIFKFDVERVIQVAQYETEVIA